MKVRAISKDTGISPRKVRPIVDIIRGKAVDEALSVLQFLTSPTARLVAKVVKSAAASAENNYHMPPELKIVEIYVDQARPLKRIRPRARGRVGRITKRSSHITVVVADQEEEVGS